MLRKSNRNINALAGMAAEALSMDHYGQRQSSRNDHTRQHSHNKSTESALQAHSLNSSIGTPSSSSSALDKANGDIEDGGSDDSDNADEDDADDSDKEAVIAPPDQASNVQAGRTLSLGGKVNAVTLADQISDYEKGMAEGSAHHNPTLDTTNGVIASQDDEDDEIYNNVDLISESDGEDPDIEQQEEANIINDVTDDMFPSNDLGDFNIFADSSLFPGDVPYFDEQIRQISYSSRADDVQSYSSAETFVRPLPSPPPPTPTTATRRVHFDTSAFKSPYTALDDEVIVFPADLHFDNESESSSGGFSGYESGSITRTLTYKANLYVHSRR